MNRSALGPTDKIETFHDALEDGTPYRVHFASFGPIRISEYVEKAIVIRVVESADGLTEYSVGGSPFQAYDIADMAAASARAAAFVAGAKRAE